MLSAKLVYFNLVCALPYVSLYVLHVKQAKNYTTLDKDDVRLGLISNSSHIFVMIFSKKKFLEDSLPRNTLLNIAFNFRAIR